MAQFTPPARAKHLFSIAECLLREGKVKLSLHKFDFLVRHSVISAKSGLNQEERSEVESALTTVLMTIAADMAFVACPNANKVGLRERLHVLLDESLDWSEKKNSKILKGEDFKGVQKSNNDNDA